jgi:hypothetical protein
LRGVVVLPRPARNGDGAAALRVRVRAGSDFAELLAAVHGAGLDYMPHTCPTAASISLGGALAANTHGRTSQTYGGYFADHVPWFRLIGADGRAYECASDSPGGIEQALYRYVPGSLGALGLVTELEIELISIAPNERVITEVLETREADPCGILRAYRAAARDNTGAPRRWSEGISAVFFGRPHIGTSVLLGRSRDETLTKTPVLPLFRDRPTQDAILHGLLHRFPAHAQTLAAMLFRRIRRFGSEYYRWAFFQSAYDAAIARLSSNGYGWRALGMIGVDPRLTLVHQGWAMPDEALEAFMQVYFDLIERPQHRLVAECCEFQDLLPLPCASAPLSASHGFHGGSHIFTLSCAVRSAAQIAAAKAFCAELSLRGHRHDLGVRVHLVKQLHVEDDVLREMYREPLAELRALKRRVDPHGLLRSRTLERLDVGAA